MVRGDYRQNWLGASDNNGNTVQLGSDYVLVQITRALYNARVQRISYPQYYGLVLKRAFKDTFEPYLLGPKAYIGNIVTSIITLAVLLIIGGQEEFSSELIVLVSGIFGTVGWLAVVFLVNLFAAPAKLMGEKDAIVIDLREKVGFDTNRTRAKLRVRPYSANKGENIEFGMAITNLETKIIRYAQIIFRSMRIVHTDNLLGTTQQLPWGGINDKRGTQVTLQPGQPEVAVIVERDPEAKAFKVSFAGSREYEPGVYQATIEISGLLENKLIQNLISFQFEFLETFFFGEPKIEDISHD